MLAAVLGDAKIGTNKSAVLSGIARSSDADTEFLSNVPHNLRECLASSAHSSAINLETDKSSVVAMPPVLARVSAFPFASARQSSVIGFTCHRGVFHAFFSRCSSCYLL